MIGSEQEYLDRVRRFAEEMRPMADRLDTDAVLLRELYRLYCAEGLNCAGSFVLPLSGSGYYKTLSLLGSVSGAFGFIVLQQLAANMTAGGALEADPWPMAGVAFGHLRNPSGTAPILQNGRAGGIVPWMSGSGLFEKTVLGLRTEEGEEVFCVVSARSRPAFRHGTPMRLMACSSTRTVQVCLTSLRVPASAIFRRDLVGTQALQDEASVLYQTPLPAGCIMACRDLIVSSVRVSKRARDNFEEAAAGLLSRTERAFQEGRSEEGAMLRAELGDFAVRSARLAALACGGSSLAEGHIAGRLYKEALLYNLMAATDYVAEQAFAQMLGFEG